MLWIDGDENTSSMLWLYGFAGTGKSALAQTLAELLKTKGQLLASFFFSRTSGSNCSDGNAIIPTLVYQLTLAFPEIRPHIEAYISKDPAIFQKSRTAQMHHLFIQPLLQCFPAVTAPKSESPATPIERKRSPFSLKKYLKKISEEPQTPTSQPSSGDFRHVIIVDGLDECRGQEIQCDILKVIADAIPQLPFPIKFLVASRPESYLKQFFDHHLSSSGALIPRIDLSLDQDVRNDIRKFLVKEFQEIRRVHPLRRYLDSSWPTQEDIEKLVDESSLHFIYASTVIRHIRSPKDRPDKRLTNILSMTPGVPILPSTLKAFTQLDSLYTHVFSSVDDENHELVWRIIGIVFLTHCYEPDFEDINLDGSPLALEELLGLDAGLVEVLLDPLLSLVEIPHNPSHPVRVLHASIYDFLLDPARSGLFSLDLGPAHRTITEYQYSKIITTTGGLFCVISGSEQLYGLTIHSQV